MTDGRKRITRLLASLGIIAVCGSLLSASPSSAEPDIEDVQQRVEELYHEAEIASERYNEVRHDMQLAQTRLKSLRTDLDRKEHQVEEIRQQVVSSILAQSQGQAFSTATQVAVSEDPDAFLERLIVVSQYNEQQNQVKSQFAAEIKQLEMRQEAAQRELSEIASAKEDLAEHKATIDEKADEAKALLHDLKAEAAARAAERASRDLERDPAPAPAPTPAPTPTPTPAPTSSVSGRAGAAVDYALAQVGDAYVWGATGPDGFDCSGLTMMAWAQAGVSLPHSSSSQMSSGTPVSQSDLQPGDLVFFYSPVSHVGIYIGDGKMVHAANPTDGVRADPISYMPYSGAVRPG